MMFIKQQLLGLLPFVLATRGGEEKLNVQRIIEAVFTVAVTALVTMYGTQQVLATKIEYLAKQEIENRASINDLSDRLIAHIQQDRIGSK